MIKYINPGVATALSLALDIWARGEAIERFEQLPDDKENGAPVTTEQIQELLDKYIPMFNADLKKLVEVTELPETPIEPWPDPEPPVVEKPEYEYTQVFDLRTLDNNNKKFTWLPRQFQGKMEAYFPGDNFTFHIPDASVTVGADGTTDHNQAFWFCGTDFPESSHENNNNMPSIFGIPGGTSTTVEIRWNK